MKEIEILIKVKDTKEQVLIALEEYESVGKKKTTDIYFYDPLRDDLQPGNDLRLRRSFRLRDKDEASSLTYKIDNFNREDVWTYSDEHEIKVDNTEEEDKILKHLGLKELVRINSEKYIFKTPEYEIVFEDVRDLGYFLEVEKLEQVDDGEEEETKEKVREFINNLDIEFGDELNAGKPELMLKEKGIAN